VPAARRARQPLVVCGERIVWVCGLVLAEEGRITRKTASLVRLSVSSGADGAGGRPRPDGPAEKGE
jgi:hypothetical protein